MPDLPVAPGGLEDYPYLLLVRTMTPQLRAVLSREERDYIRFRRLPFVSLASSHPWVAGPLPPGVGVLHAISKVMLGLCVGIEKTLRYAFAIRRMSAFNGNAWAWGGDGEVPYPMMGSADGEQSVDLARGLLVPCTLGFPAVLNLSVAVRLGLVLADTDPLSVATRIASKYFPVVVAAGNWGQAEGLDTLSGLARLPWCISVGATADEAGRTLWPKSSAGSGRRSSDAPRADGPTVVAYGQNSYVPSEFGTSFAAPRVSRAAQAVTALLLQVRATQLQPDGQMGSCPLVLMQSIDTGYRDFVTRPSLPLPMMPLVGVSRAHCRTALEALAEVGIRDLDPVPDAVRRIITSSAQPVPGRAEHEVGAGFVSDESVARVLERLTALDYAQAMWPDLELPGSTRQKLAGLPLAEPAELPALLQIARRSAIVSAVDFKSLKEHRTTPTEEEMAKSPRVSMVPDPGFWPPAVDDRAVYL